MAEKPEKSGEQDIPEVKGKENAEKEEEANNLQGKLKGRRTKERGSSLVSGLQSCVIYSTCKVRTTNDQTALLY